MPWFFNDDKEDTKRKPYGILRYRQLLGREWKNWMKADFPVLLFFIPFALGVTYAVLSESILVLIPASLIGGAFIGPAISVMMDSILRSFRDNRDDVWVSWRKAWRNNWKESVVPGMVFGLFLGFFIFMGMLFYWSEVSVPLSTLLMYFFSMTFVMMVFSVYWPQLVLFRQKTGVRLRNTVLFALRNFPVLLLSGAVQVIWWLLAVFLVPWSAYLLPFLGIWAILFISQFIIYDRMDKAFLIEKQIFDAFPYLKEEE